MKQDGDPLSTTHNIHEDDDDDILRDKIFAVAPMVEQSDKAFRLLCRKYGANLCFTPMIHARWFVQKKSHRQKMWEFSAADRPLVAQFCGSNADILLQAARLVEHQVDAIDLNCGCPTQVAKRGRFGAFLLPSGDFLVSIVRHLVQHLSCPVTVKVRLLPGPVDKSIALYRDLVDAGAAMLTIHGRTQAQKGVNTGPADWEAIRQVVQALGDRVPILANGNISSFEDVRACLEYTGADGVMSSEAILEYPPNVFLPRVDASYRPGPGRLAIAREYLDLARQHPPEKGGGATSMQCQEMHLDTFLHEDWQSEEGQALRYTVRQAKGVQDLYHILDRVAAVQNRNKHDVKTEQLSWYFRHRKNYENCADTSD